MKNYSPQTSFRTQALTLAIGTLFVSGLAFATLPACAAEPAGEVIDLGASVPDPARIRDGLFPEDTDCPDKAELEKAGFKCMGNERAPSRFSLPAIAFKVGSADIPELFKRQLDAFVTALSPLRGSGRRVHVYGHADASGAADANTLLSQRRAESVKTYLVQQGVEAQMLQPVGLGAREPKNAADPTAPENRRVEIGR